jgi:DNA-damage-inducible protein J
MNTAIRADVTGINIKIDAQTQAQAALLFEQMGLDQSTAVELFFRQAIRERGLPFLPRLAPSLDDLLIEAAFNSGAPARRLETNDRGHIVLDENGDSDLLDWAKNG